MPPATTIIISTRYGLWPMDIWQEKYRQFIGRKSRRVLKSFLKDGEGY
jgi:hypothetical protein